MEDANGQYDLASAWNRVPTAYNAPSGSWEETALRQARLVLTMPRAEVQALVAPPLPQISPGPQRHRKAISVSEVLNTVDRYGADDRRSWFSGTPAGYSGSTRNGWSGE